MRTFLKGILWFVLIVAALLYVVINHSEARQELVCKGHWRDDPSGSETAFVQLNEYRPWVALWSNGTEGNVKVTTDKIAVSTYIPYVSRTFDGMLTLYTFNDYDYGKGQVGTFRGGYRVANREITIEFAPTDVFIGVCDP